LTNFVLQNGTVDPPVVVKEEFNPDGTPVVDEAMAAANAERRRKLLSAIKRKRESMDSTLEVRIL